MKNFIYNHDYKAENIIKSMIKALHKVKLSKESRPNAYIMYIAICYYNPTMVEGITWRLKKRCSKIMKTLITLINRSK